MDSSRTCDQCGKPLPAEGRFCTHCGSFSGESGTASSPGSESRIGPWERILERLRTVTASRYDVQRLLGWGGMAGVYLAEELRLKRRVAIKVIAPGLLMDPSQIERFEQEARTTAQLNHPHIVTIYEVDEREDLHYFTMTYVPGRALSQVMAEAAAPLPIEVVEAWVRQVAGALSYAHQRGVVHRDIKPGNILLDERGSALVGDFGIAKVAEEPGLTRTGMLVGTPAYMSPEQCTTGKVTGASDQYSLGAVAYQLIVGAPPFSGSTIHVIQAHVGEVPRDLRELRPECPDTLADVVMRMLAKAPEDRWPSLYDAVDAIGGRALRHDDPVRGIMAQLSAWTHGVRIEPPAALAGDDGASTLQPGDGHAFGAVALDYRGEVLPDRLVDWTVEPEGVLEVDEEGQVRALTPGRAKVIATSGRVRAEWAVKVGSSTTTGLITPPVGIPAPEGLAPSGDPEPTPGPPPPSGAVPAGAPLPEEPVSSEVLDPDVPEPFELPEPVTSDPAPREEPGADLVMDLDNDNDADDDEDEDTGRVDPTATRGSPTPSRAPDGVDAGARSNRVPMMAGLGVLGLAAVALVVALSGDDGPPDLSSDTNPAGDPAAAEAEAVRPPAVDATPVLEDDSAAPASEGESDQAQLVEAETPPATERTAAEDPVTPPPPPPPGRVRIGGSSPAGALVRVRGNGVDRAVAGSVELPPGAYTFEASASGFETIRETLTVVSGQAREWTPRWVAIPRPPVQPPRDTASAPPPADPTPVEPGEEEAETPEARSAAIVGTILGFATALESRDTARVRAAWPSITQRALDGWAALLGASNIRTVRATVESMGGVPAAGDRVEVPFRLRLDLAGSVSPPPQPYRAVVERIDGSWTLTDLVAGG